MATINSIVSGQAIPQIYRLNNNIAPEELSVSLQAASGELFYLDGTEMTSKDRLMQEFAAVLNFPDYFGDNWDALHDCLDDVDWQEDGATHSVLLLDHWDKCASPHLLETLQDVMASWLKKKATVYVLLRTTAADEYVQKLPAVN